MTALSQMDARALELVPDEPGAEPSRRIMRSLLVTAWHAQRAARNGIGCVNGVGLLSALEVKAAEELVDRGLGRIEEAQIGTLRRFHTSAELEDQAA